MVDFPAPDLPSIPKISPFFTENETLFSIFFFIYILVKFSTVNNIIVFSSKYFGKVEIIVFYKDDFHQ